MLVMKVGLNDVECIIGYSYVGVKMSIWTKVDVLKATTRDLRLMLIAIEKELEIRKDDVSTDLGLNAREVNLLDKGHKIECVKAYRERIGCSLLEAKDVADTYRAEFPILSLSRDERILALSGDKIAAIRSYQHRVSTDLPISIKVAKEAVEEFLGSNTQTWEPAD